MRQIGRNRWAVNVAGWTVGLCRGPSDLWYWNVTHPTAGQFGADYEYTLGRALHAGRQFAANLQEVPS